MRTSQDNLGPADPLVGAGVQNLLRSVVLGLLFELRCSSRSRCPRPFYSSRRTNSTCLSRSCFKRILWGCFGGDGCLRYALRSLYNIIIYQIFSTVYILGNYTSRCLTSRVSPTGIYTYHKAEAHILFTRQLTEKSFAREIPTVQRPVVLEATKLGWDT